MFEDEHNAVLAAQGRSVVDVEQSDEEARRLLEEWLYDGASDDNDVLPGVSALVPAAGESPQVRDQNLSFEAIRVRRDGFAAHWGGTASQAVRR